MEYSKCCRCLLSVQPVLHLLLQKDNGYFEACGAGPYVSGSDGKGVETWLKKAFDQESVCDGMGMFLCEQQLFTFVAFSLAFIIATLIVKQCFIFYST